MQLSNLEYLPTISSPKDWMWFTATLCVVNMWAKIFVGTKNIVGSELTTYTELLEEARQEAMNRMITKAQVLGADAIVGIRFSTSNITAGASELFVYGTAVKVQKKFDPFGQSLDELPVG